MGGCGTRPAEIVDGEVGDDAMPPAASWSNQRSNMTPPQAAEDVGPSLLSVFHEDIMLTILSFVADVPFELQDRCKYNLRSRAPVEAHSTLTHVLPYVSKKFNQLCSNHDLYWKSALLRLVREDPVLWGDGLKRVVFDSECDELRDAIRTRNQARAKRAKRSKTNQTQPTDSEVVQNPSSSEQGDNITAENSALSDDSDLSDDEKLLEKGCRALESHPPRHHTASSSGIYQCLFQTILNRHLRFQAPVFYMPSEIRLGTPYGLHFFEPRYRLLIAEAMRDFPVSARRGEAIKPIIPGLSRSSNSCSNNVTTVSQTTEIETLLGNNEDIMKKYHLPTFIHAHESPLRRNTPASIVQVCSCIIQPDGAADVFLMPVGYIWVEELWERPRSGGLYEARGLRMPRDESDKYEMWCFMRRFGNGDGRGRGQALPIP